MGINNYYQWEYIGKHIHFDLLLVESEIVLCENKSQKIEGRFRKTQNKWNVYALVNMASNNWVFDG